MARQANANGSVERKNLPPPTVEETNVAQEQMNAFLMADSALAQIINVDVNKLGTYSSPFVHPLYAVRSKLESMRRKPLRILKARGSFERKEAARIRKLAKASA